MEDGTTLDSLRQEAEHCFMGHPVVLGIAKARSEKSEILFLLSGPSRDLEAEIDRWAAVNRIHAQVKVVGQFRLLKTG